MIRKETITTEEIANATGIPEFFVVAATRCYYDDNGKRPSDGVVTLSAPIPRTDAEALLMYTGLNPDVLKQFDTTCVVVVTNGEEGIIDNFTENAPANVIVQFAVELEDVAERIRLHNPDLVIFDIHSFVETIPQMYETAKLVSHQGIAVHVIPNLACSPNVNTARMLADAAYAAEQHALQGATA